jgi:act minimal PKS acyl carrier protein
MSTFTITEFIQVLRDCAGEDEEINLDGDILDVSFEELGYDSLALLNTVSRIERDRGVNLGDDIVAEATTPGALLKIVNETFAQRS